MKKKMKGMVTMLLLISMLLPMCNIQSRAAEANWLWPVPASRTIGTRYYDGGHDGLDIWGAYNTPIVASKSGTVVKVLDGDERNWQGYGHGVVINHGDGYYSHYAHLAFVSVYQGQNVSQGQQIGGMGSSGFATGTHLHFAIATSVIGEGGRINSNPDVINYIYSAGQTIIPATLSCTVGNSASATKFSWNGGTDCEFYTLRIFRKVNGTYTDTNSVWNLKTRSHNVVLPAGDYRAYVDCVIGSNYKASNEIYFTVESSLIPATLSCTAGNSASATKFSWNGGTDCEFYTLRIFRKVNGTYTDTNSVWNLKTRSHNVVLPAGDYRAYVDCVIGSNYKASNEVYFTVQEWKEWEYSKNSDGTIALTKYKGNATEVVIPATYDGYQVSCVGNIYSIVGAFDNNTTIKKVVISEGITKLQSYAFYGCKNLESVTLPDSLEELENCAFYGCKNLKSIILPEKLKEINSSVFCKSGIVSIVLPEGITRINLFAFADADSLQSVTVLGELTHIGRYAFQGCDNLLTISFAKGVQNIGDQAFDNCKNLKSILIPRGVETIGKEAFKNCEKLESVTVFGNVEQIGTDAFTGCPKDMKVSSTADSALREYAKTNQISYEVITALKGDADNNGSVDSKDALAILKYSVHIDQSEFNAAAADCDGEDGITSKDALAILKYTVGLLHEFN